MKDDVKESPASHLQIALISFSRFQTIRMALLLSSQNMPKDITGSTWQFQPITGVMCNYKVIEFPRMNAVEYVLSYDSLGPGRNIYCVG